MSSDDDDNLLPYLNEADPDAWEGWSISPVDVDGAINWNQDEGAGIGNFAEDQAIPQIPGWGDSSDGIVGRNTRLPGIIQGPAHTGCEQRRWLQALLWTQPQGSTGNHRR